MRHPNIRNAVACLTCETIHPSAEDCPICLNRGGMRINIVLPPLFSTKEEEKHGLSKSERDRMRIPGQDVSAKAIDCGYIVLDCFFPTDDYIKLREMEKANFERSCRKGIPASQTDQVDNFRRKLGEFFSGIAKGRRWFNAGNAVGLEQGIKTERNYQEKQ